MPVRSRFPRSGPLPVVVLSDAPAAVAPPAPLTRPLVLEVDESPGNGSRYRLIIAVQPGDRITIAWPDQRWACGDFTLSNLPDALWLEGSGRLGRSDAAGIAAAVRNALAKRGLVQL